MLEIGSTSHWLLLYYLENYMPLTIFELLFTLHFPKVLFKPINSQEGHTYSLHASLQAMSDLLAHVVEYVPSSKLCLFTPHTNWPLRMNYSQFLHVIFGKNLLEMSISWQFTSLNNLTDK